MKFRKHFFLASDNDIVSSTRFTDVALFSHTGMHRVLLTDPLSIFMIITPMRCHAVHSISY